MFRAVCTLDCDSKGMAPVREERIKVGFRSSASRCSKWTEMGRLDDLIPAARDER